MSSRFTRPTVAAYVQRTSFARISSPGVGTAWVVALDARVMVREVPRLAREVLEGDVLELRRRLDEELGDRVGVGLGVGLRRCVLLDQRRAGAFLHDDHESPERLAGRRDPDVERL